MGTVGNAMGKERGEAREEAWGGGGGGGGAEGGRKGECHVVGPVFCIPQLRPHKTLIGPSLLCGGQSRAGLGTLNPLSFRVFQVRFCVQSSASRHMR